jgi:hypothetical protein
VRLLRALVIVLAGLVGGGHALLDSCLAGCHSDAQPAAHCHEGAAPGGGTAWQSTSSCGHDHDELSADAVSQGRADSPLKLLSPAVLPGVATLGPSVHSILLERCRDRHASSGSPAFTAPLRV